VGRGGRGGGGGHGTLSLPTWPDRERRAATLAERYPHAAELLTLYEALLHLQEPLCYHPRIPAWFAATDAGGVAGQPLLKLERLPVEELGAEWTQFWTDAKPALNRVLAPIAVRLAAPEIGAAEMSRFLAARTEAPTLETRAPGAQPPGAGRPEEVRRGFFAHAFLLPIIERLGALAAQGAPNRTHGPPEARHRCPVCGRPPVVGTLADEPDARGQRRLVCSLCGTAWTFPRLTCAACGVSDAEALTHHVSEEWPHVRIDACADCGAYIKTVDLRVAGDAVPIVDELASLDLDLWARDRGLKKRCLNVLGL